jgi:hypothetical protein
VTGAAPVADRPLSSRHERTQPGANIGAFATRFTTGNEYLFRSRWRGLYRSRHAAGMLFELVFAAVAEVDA